MGHIRLGRLPTSRKWKEVVALLGGGAELSQIADATALAAEAALKHAAKDPAFERAFWLLTQLPDAARSDDFVRHLRALGIQVPKEPTLLELTAAYSDAVDTYVRRSGRNRTDLGEMALLAAVESLTDNVGSRLPGLFQPGTSDVRSALSAVATTKQFGEFARSYFSNLTNRYLSYFLSRELSNFVGPHFQIGSIDQRRDFDAALSLHCDQAAGIVESFAGDWFSKHRFAGDITVKKARDFASYAFEKVRRELRQRRGPDAD